MGIKRRVRNIHRVVLALFLTLLALLLVQYSHPRFAFSDLVLMVAIALAVTTSFEVLRLERDTAYDTYVAENEEEMRDAFAKADRGDFLVVPKPDMVPLASLIRYQLGREDVTIVEHEEDKDPVLYA